MMQELNYIHCSDYYIPDIRLPEENRPIGRWGGVCTEIISRSITLSASMICVLAVNFGHIWLI